MFPGEQAKQEIQERNNLYQECLELVDALEVCLKGLPVAAATKRPPMIKGTTSLVNGNTFGEKPVAVSAADVFDDFKKDIKATRAELETIIDAGKESIKPDRFAKIRDLLKTGSKQIDATVRKLQDLENKKGLGMKRGGGGDDVT